jgi:phosphoribosyl 1,2-cyclic phosphodiesterase
VANQRYGGNTACVVVEAPGSDPIVLDLGTGLRFFGDTQPADGSFRGHALVTHLHWDHVQGLPFFVPVHRPGARLDIHGPADCGIDLATAFDRFMNPPFFPVGIDELAGDIAFHTLEEGTFELGPATVVARSVPHIGRTFGYRVTIGGRSVVYLPDHQQPQDGSHHVDPAVLELCRDADLLIHDAQYTAEEFARKAHWGHSTVDYAVTVAAAAGARRLVLFHHDPEHGDAVIDGLLAAARVRGAAEGIEEVLAAEEGLAISLTPVPAAAATI